MEKRKLTRATTVVVTTSALVALGGPAYADSSESQATTVLDVATTSDSATRGDAEPGIPVTILDTSWRHSLDKQGPSEEPAEEEELPATGYRVGFVAAVGSSVLLTGALAFLAARGRRRMLRGADYW